MIRKEGKARWVYECEPCHVRRTSPDQFRAIEHQQRHEKGFGHFGNAVGSIVRESFAPLMSAFGWGTPAHVEDVMMRVLWEGSK
jgi:hypothetical protein